MPAVPLVWVRGTPEGSMGAVEHLKSSCCLGLKPESAMVAVTPLHEIIPHGWSRMAISLWLCPLFMIWYVYEAGFKPAIVLLCIALALRLPLIALERLALQGSEWRISIGGIVAVPVLLACLVLLILQQS
jgi:hypothetical protein